MLWKLLCAVVLLASDVLVPKDVEDCTEEVAALAFSQGLVWEGYSIWNDGSVGGCLNFADCICFLRNRRDDMATLPPLSVCDRLPAQALTQKMLEWNYSYYIWVNALLELDMLHQVELEDARDEGERCRRILFQISYATDPKVCEYERRIALDELLRMAPDIFYGRQMPQAVPLHRIPIASTR